MLLDLSEDSSCHDCYCQSGLHIAGTAAIDPAVGNRSAEWWKGPGAGVANRKGIEVAIEDKTATWPSATQPSQKVRTWWACSDTLEINTWEPAEYLLDGGNDRPGITGGVLAIDPNQLDTKRH